jgi:hypothetical protein
VSTTPVPVAAAAASPRRRKGRLVRHYLEMLAAMGIGMGALGWVWRLVLEATGAGAVLHLPEPMALVMATNMTIGMTVLMRWRRHSWRACAEMGAAMYLPFVALFVPMWAGVLSSGGMFLWGHVLMLFTMAGAMALRLDEYAQH